MKLNFQQNNFASGQLSPEVWARSDRPFYKNGLEVCLNFIPTLTGGARFRPGTIYSVHSRLNGNAWGIPFRFNLAQSYSLEFTDYKLRIHHDGGVAVEAAKNITGLSAASPGVFTVSTHGFSTGDEVFVDGIIGPDILNDQFYLVVVVNPDTFSLTDVHGNAVNTTSLDAYVSGGTVERVYEITSPYTAAQAQQIKFCGTADLMYLYHPSLEPRVLIRSGALSWSVATYSRYSAELLITGITNASPGVITTGTAHGLATGDIIYLAQIEGTIELNKSEFQVVYINATTFSLKTLAGAAIDTTSYGVYVEGGKVSRVRNVGKAITAITKADPGVVTIAGHGFATYDKILISGVGGMTELNDLYFWVKKIDANTFSLTDELGADIDTTGYTTFTSGGTASLVRMLFTKIGDFPGAGGFYGGRHAVGGSDNDPDTFWLSRGPDPETGESEYDDFSIGTEDTDGMVHILSSQNFQAHRIYWFSGVPKFMIAGTSSGIYKINGGSDGAAITPSAIVSDPVTSVGVADMMPLIVNTQTYYVEQGGRNLRSFGYSLLEDSYKAFDKNVLSDEITYPGIVQIVFAKGRPEIILAVLSNGKLLTCTILESDDVAGWAPQPIGGDGEVLSVVVEPQSTGVDRVGIFIERTIDGQTCRYIEYLSEDPRVPDPVEYFTDEDSEDEDKAAFEKIVFEEQKKFVRLDSALIRDTTQTATLTLGALSGASVTATAGSSVFKAAHVGQYIYAKFLTGYEAGIAEIIGYTSGTVVTVRIVEAFLALSFASGAWYLTDQIITGLGHLEGETVGVLTDGAVHADETVTDGAITLDYPARYVILGKRYKGFLRSLDFDLAGAAGTAIGRLKSVDRFFVKLRNTMGGKVGFAGFYDLISLMFRREGASYYDRPPALFSGLKDVPLKNGYSTEKRFYALQDEPLPMTVLGVVPGVDVGDEE